MASRLPSAPQDVPADSNESAQETSPALDPSLYPVTYGSSFGAALAYFSAVIGIFWLTVIGRGHLLLNRSSGVWTFVLLMSGLAILITLDFIFARITLYPDRIERKTWFSKRVMQRSDIAGMRLEGLFRVPSLQHKEIKAFLFRLPKGINKDAAWNAWMASVPDLDALDENKVLADIKKYPRLGTATQERELHWDIANKLAMICVWATLAAMLFVFVPSLSVFAAAVLIVTPWIALFNMNLYGVLYNSARRNPAIGNSLTLFFAGVGLGIFGALYPAVSPGVLYFQKGARHIHFLIAGPIFGLILFIPMLRVVLSKSHWKDLPTRVTAGVFLVPLMILTDWGYGLGTSMEINTLFDSSKPTLYLAKVEKINHAEKRFLNIQIGAWGTTPATNIGVPGGAFRQVKINDTVCIRSHEGFLYAWYFLTLCQYEPGAFLIFLHPGWLKRKMDSTSVLARRFISHLTLVLKKHAFYNAPPGSSSRIVYFRLLRISGSSFENFEHLQSFPDPFRRFR